MKRFLFLSLFILFTINLTAQETVTFSGRVTDFEGNPVDSSIVKIVYPDFSNAYETYSDKNGYYKLENIKKGKYVAMFVMRPEEYPRANAVPEKDMRLEFWAWNVIADRDLTINPRYQKLELYGTTVFEELGGMPVLFVYFRPMSLTKLLKHSKEVYLDKKKSEEVADLSISPENLEVKIFADDEQLKIIAVTPVEDGLSKSSKHLSYLVQVERPKTRPDKPYVIFRVEAVNKEFDEKGENLYFYELSDFKKNPVKK